MAGGTFVSYNKVRPGAYINFKGVNTPTITIGSRGVSTLALNLDWGEDGKLIDLYSEDMLYGDSLAKVGLVVDDEGAKLLKLILTNSYLCKVYKLNKGGAKAIATLGDIVATAKYTGTFGNKIAIVIKTITEGTFEVTTYANGYEVDTQRVSTVDELVANDYVEFSVKEDVESPTITAQAETLLTGGENGTAGSTTYSDYLSLLRTSQWQTLAVTDTSNNTTVDAFIKEMRDNQGKYVQAVVANYDSADYEGLINVVNGAVINDEEVTAAEFTAYVAGMTAGAEITKSNTGTVIEGATEIIDALSDNEIIEGLGKGKFILSLNQQGQVKVEKDINSLHTYSEDRNYTFSKNRVIRTLDEIGSSITDVWETTYLGKVSNNDEGRTMFKSSIINYLTELENQGAIQEFDSSTVEVLAGTDIDSVIANISVKPVDSMEFLYMTVNVTE